MKNSTITFDISLDENHVPESIEWQASDAHEKGECEAALLSIWDKKEKNTLKIDLWTKSMEVEDMKLLIHQTMLTLSDTYKRATGDEKLSNEIKDFAFSFGEKAGIITRG